MMAVTGRLTTSLGAGLPRQLISRLGPTHPNNAQPRSTLSLAARLVIMIIITIIINIISIIIIITIIIIMITTLSLVAGLVVPQVPGAVTTATIKLSLSCYQAVTAVMLSLTSRWRRSPGLGAWARTTPSSS